MDEDRRARRRALERVDELVALAEARNRADLVHRLQDVRVRLADPAIVVAVIGEFKQGKSSLVNALLGADVCPVDDVEATAVPTYVRHATETSVHALVGDRLEHRTIEDVPTLTSERTMATLRPTTVLVARPSPLLEGGLVLVDTPGLGGLDSAIGAATLGTLGRADAILFVSDASQELTATELAVLQQARRRCPAVALVLTKVDINPAWRKVHLLDAEHLAVADANDVRVFPVATPLWDLGAESGLEDLRTFLLVDVMGGADALASDAAMVELREVADHLDAGLLAEEEALDGGEAAVAALEEAVARSRRLQETGARWKVALEDGFSDLGADADHELRAAMRHLLADAEAAIDKADPAQSWGELEPWLNRRMMVEVMARVEAIEARLVEVAAEVDRRFRLDGEAVTEPLGFAIDLASAPVDVRTLDGQLRTGSSPLAKDALTALRGLQGGVMLFGVVAQIAGLALTGPAVVAFGVVMGGRSLREERRKQLALRRQRAKAPVRKWLDEVQAVVAKQTGDRLRDAQRALRDRYEEQARSLQRSTEEALDAAQRAVATAAADHERRRAVLASQRAAIAEIRAAAAP